MVILKINITINTKSMINSMETFMQNAIEHYIENASYVKDKNKSVESIVKEKIEEAKMLVKIYALTFIKEVKKKGIQYCVIKK